MAKIDFKPINFKPSQAPQEEPSTLEDFLTGAAQGAALGFSDEAMAALKAGGEALSGKTNLEDLYNTYRKYQQEGQQKVKEAQERSPIASLGGTLVGSIIPALATAGASEGASGAATMEELGQLPWKELLGRVVGAGKEGAVQGAKIAAPYALGASESNIEHPLDLAKDVASGTALGAATGGVLGAAGTALKGTAGKILEGAEKYDVSRQAKRAFEHGQAGFDIRPTSEFFNTAQQQQRADIARITDKFLEGENLLTDELYGALKDASQRGTKVNVDSSVTSVINTVNPENPGLIDLVGQMGNKIGKQRANNIVANLEKLQSGSVDPLTAWNVRKDLYSIIDEVPELKGLIKGINEQLKTDIEQQVPGVAQTAHELQNFIGAGKESLIEGGAAGRYSERGAADIANVNKKFAQEITGLLDSLTSERSGVEKQRKFGEMMDKLKDLDPMLLKKLNINPAELEKDFQQTGDLFTIAKKLGGSQLGREPFGDVMSTISGGTVPTLRGGVYEAANIAGKTADLSKQVFDLKRDQLVNLAKKLQEVPGAQYLGEALEKGLYDPSGASKNSILFVLMQRPDTRQLIKNMLSE